VELVDLDIIGAGALSAGVIILIWRSHPRSPH
jgi:hypothetical protein